MKLTFSGTVDELKMRVATLGLPGRWRWLDQDRMLQFKGENALILNWWPSTGTLQFQGRDPEAFRALWLGEDRGEPVRTTSRHPSPIIRVRAPRNATVVIEYDDERGTRSGRG